MQPMLGLIIVGPVLGPLFALIGAVIGFTAGMFGYLLYLVSGGKLGNNKIASMGNPMARMMSPTAMTLMSVFGVAIGWLATGIFTGVWSFIRQMEDLSSWAFGSPDLGPLKAICGLLIGLTLGRIVAARALAKAAPAADAGKPAVEPATAAGCCSGNAVSRLAVRVATIAAFSYVGLFVATGWHTGNWNPVSQPTDIVAWFHAPVNTAVEVVHDWPAYRGGPARTGSLDNHPGPVAGKVLWVYKGGLVQFIATPAAVGDYVFAGGTDGGTGGYLFVFNAAAAQDPRKQIARRETMPFALYSAPALVDGLLVFGEGLHEDKKTSLRCRDMNDPNARILWELSVPSHVESGPAVVDGRVYVGGGDDGVLCVDLRRVKAAGGAVDARTIKPNPDDEFPDIPVPVVHWRNKVSDPASGKLMHVDTAPAVVGDSVVVGSGQFEEHGKTVGDRAVICLNAADGSVRWRVPVEHNPWASPAVVGDRVFVGCSSERFEEDKLARSVGEVICLSLSDGKLLWRHKAGGGVLSSVAVSGKSVVFCDSGGSVTALDLEGKPIWQVKPAGGFMSAPTISGGYVYTADVAGVVVALKLADGSEVWRLQLADHPEIRKPGPLIASPAAAGGRLFLGTEGGYFVAIGEK
jgi:outer membrane protein assembly factor BamB